MTSATDDPVGIRALVLAAGRGERLRPLTDEIAKPALDVGGRPLASYSLAMVAPVGGRVAINLWWRAEETKTALSPFAPQDARWLVESPRPFGSAGTVAALLDELASTFVVANGDVITDLYVARLLDRHDEAGAAATLAVHPAERKADLEIADGRAQRFIDRRTDPDASGYLYMGVGVFERDAVATLVTPGEEAGLGETVLAPLVDRGDVAVLVHEGMWLDVGTPERLEQARSAMSG